MKSWIRWARLLAAGLLLAGALLTAGLGSLPAYGAPGDQKEEVIVEPVSGLITDEWGGSSTFVIYLTDRPRSSVQISLSSSNSQEGMPSPTYLLISPDEWRTRHVITVTGVDDGMVDGDIAYQVLTSDTLSQDADFDGLKVDDVRVTNLDNDASGPVANDDSDITAEDTSVATPVLDNDQGVNIGPVILSVTAGPAHGTTVVGSNQRITYTPDPNFYGTDAYTYQVSYPTGASDSAQVQITVSPVNDTPVAVNDTGSIAEDLSLTINVLANDTDVDGDLLTIVDLTQPSHGIATVVNGEILYVPLLNFSGSDSFSYTIDDGHGAQDTAAVTINIGLINDPPDAQDDSLSTAIEVPANVAVLNNDTDPDGDTLLLDRFDAISAEGGTVTRRTSGTPDDLSDDLLLYTPAAGFSGSDSFTYVASDGVLTDTAIVNVSVAANPNTPLANDDSYSLDEGTTLEVGVEDGVLGNDVNPAQRALTAELVTGPDHGLLDFLPDGSFTYTPDSGYSGEDGFQYQALSGPLVSSPASVTLTVRSVNQAPVANDDRFTVGASGALTVTNPGVLENDTDPDGQPLMAVLDSLPAHGTLALNPDGSFTYQPQAGFIGDDQFTYTASDGEDSSALAVVEIAVPDLIPPTVQWVSPTATSQRFDVGAELVRLEVSATDNAAVDRVHFFRWDSRLEMFVDIAMLTEPPYQVDLNAELLNPEWNQVFVRAYDSAGNVSERQFIWLFQTQQTANFVYLVSVHR